MNKKLAILFGLLLSVFVTIAQTHKQFILNGKFPGQSAGIIYLSYPDGRTVNWKLDSCFIKQGNFSFKGSIPHPSLARLYYAGKDKELFLEPTVMTCIAVFPEFNKSKITGSKTQSEFDRLNVETGKIKSRWKVVMDTIAAVNKRSNAAAQELKGWVLGPYFEEMKETNYNFFAKYPASYVTAYSLMIEGRQLTDDSLKLFYTRFPAAVKNSYYGKEVFSMLEKRKIAVPGSKAIGFVKTDLNGNKIDLAEFKGNYVLLDFWGSWCVPCRKGNPHLRQLYSKYKERGIEFIGVASDDATPDAWRKAVQEDQLEWPQVLRGSNTSVDISKNYNIVYYPTKILIDKEGKIIGRYGEDMAALDRMLESIFK